MSYIFLNVGQCGNQLGHSFWDEIASSKWTATSSTKASTGSKPQSKSVATFTHSNPFLLCDGSLPCILVDAEPKVIKHCLASRGSSSRQLFGAKVREECVISDKMGRGNNWAFGYHGHRRTMGEPSMLDKTLEAVRKCLERCDRFSGFIMLHSVSGGTGSGLGSAVIENLRHAHPASLILCVAITPFRGGETPLQHLNSSLCLAWLHRYSDAVLLFSNDSVMDQIKRQRQGATGGSASSNSGSGLGGGRRSGEVTMADMNGHISGVLGNLFMPLWKPKQGFVNLSGQEPWELVRSVCPDPALKFLTPHYVQLTQPASRWSQATSHLSHHASTSSWSDIGDPVKARASSLLLVARGSPVTMETFSPGNQWKVLEARLKKAYSTVEWNPFPLDCWRSYEKNFGHLKMATVLANSSSVVNYLADVRGRSEVMWRSGAYLHWYERFRCEKDSFPDAFAVVDGVIDNYSKM